MHEFLAMFKRRRTESIIAALLVMLLGTSLALKVPASYRSTATIIVENNQSVSDDFSHSISGYADRRIKLISKRVLTSANLSQVARTFELYSKESFKQDGMLNAGALGNLRHRISLDLIKVKAVDPRTRYAVESAIAFDLSFTSGSPETSQLVAQHLADLFLEESRSNHSLANLPFNNLLEEQVSTLREQVALAEDQLKSFKTETIFTLPEMKETNLRILDKTETELSDTRLQLRSLTDQKIFLASELKRLKPYAIIYDVDGKRILGAEDQLKILQIELASKHAIYSAAHPDIRRLEGKISNLADVSRGRHSTTNALITEISQLEIQKAQLSNNYAPAHPSIRELNHQIATLEETLATQRIQPPIQKNINDADNPAYISTAANLKAVELDIQEQQARIVKLKDKHNTYEQRIENSPAVEREYNELTRHRQQALDKYLALSKKSFTANLSGSLVRSNQNQELVLLEPANQPEGSYKPNRKILLMITVFLSILSAIGMTLFREHLDDRVWTSADVAKEMLDSPLVSIPEFKVTQPIQLVFLSDVIKGTKEKEVSHA